MPVKVFKMSDNAARCCFCRAPARFWYSPTRPRGKRHYDEVACCQGCASIHDAKDMPTREEWIAAESERIKCGGDDPYRTSAGKAICVGDRVRKCTGDYTFEGQVIAIVTKRSGAVRYVVEDDRGLLLILNESQIDT